MRIYLPTLVSEVNTLVATGVLLGRKANCATPGFLAAVRSEYGEDADEEFAEYLAMYEAAYSAIDLIAASEGAVPLRLVLAADIPEVAVTFVPDHPGVVEVPEIQLAQIVSAHIDEDTEGVRSAITDIARALGNEIKTDGDGPSDVATTIIEESELLWYDVSELAQLPQC